MDRLSTGIAGLDQVLNGGFIPERSYLVKGEAGTGKTTMGLHYLTAQNDQPLPLYITFDQNSEDLQADMQTLGHSPERVEFLDLSPDSSRFQEDDPYDVFSEGVVEWQPISNAIQQAVRETDADRVVIDSVTRMRFMAQDHGRYRKQIQSCLRFLHDHGITPLLLSEADGTTASRNAGDQYICDGVIELGNDQVRELNVPKFRGSNTERGPHHFRITDDGIEVYPRLNPDSFSTAFQQEPIPSGVPEIDDMLHGGIERGTTTMVIGPSGVGKTTTGVQFMKEAASRNEKSTLFTFEESRQVITHRCEQLNIPVSGMVEQGVLKISSIEPLSITELEFANRVKRDVMDRGTEVVMIDSLAGYRLSFRDDHLQRNIRSISRMLQNMGVTLILVSEIPNITGEFQISEQRISHLAENVIFLRYLETSGKLKKAIGVLKKRLSNFENTLRRFQLTEEGMHVSDPIDNLEKILSGQPEPAR